MTSTDPAGTRPAPAALLDGPPLGAVGNNATPAPTATSTASGPVRGFLRVSGVPRARNTPVTVLILKFFS